MLVVVDLGNSALKFGAFDGDRLVATERVEGGRDVASGVIPFSYFSIADEVVVAASAPDQVVHLLERAERPVRVLGEDVQRRIDGTYADPTELGLDRSAALYGGRERAAGACVVVDAGTAVTVDGIRADGQVVPVAIAPGLTAASRGLKTCAPHLPWPPIEPGDVRVPARGTRDALRAGFVLGVAGLVERLIAETRRAVGGDPPVLLTGGDAVVLGAHLPVAHRVEPDLVLHGIRALHRKFPA